MYTEERLFTYLQHFERDFSRTRTRIIDATEGGAQKRGATSMSLRDALNRFATRPLAASHSPHSGLRWDLLPQCARALEQRITEAVEIQQISQETLPLLEEVRDNLADQKRVNRAIARIDILRSRMNEFGLCYQLIMQLTQKSELNRFRADQKISASKVDGAQRQRLQVQRDIENVRSVIEAAVEFQSLITQTMARIAEFGNSRKEAA
jgi:hypothetical protein